MDEGRTAQPGSSTPNPDSKRRASTPRRLALGLALATLFSFAHDLPPGEGGGGGGDAALSDLPCVGGLSDIYPCSNVDLLSFIPLSEFGHGEANDLWGWRDPQSGIRYVLLGLEGGLAFVDLSDPKSPIYVGFLPTASSSSAWRDVKVYDDHAFVVSEATGHGMQVFDLSQLGSAVNRPVQFSATATYTGFGDAHNLAINEESGYAYAVGTPGSCSKGLHIVDIINPVAPVQAGCFHQDGYTHDTQCVIYQGPDGDYVDREICFSANEDTLTISDVTNKGATVLVSRNPYSGYRYTHQGWLTEDHRYFLLGDELDERDFGHDSRIYIWDLSDLDAPSVVGHYTGPTGAIDHNLYVDDAYVYQANYRAGVRILRIGDLANAELVEVGFFDTYPADDAAEFNAVWSVYPYFGKGLVAASDIEQGLFLLSFDRWGVPECSDGIDNDADGAIDAPADPGCLDATWPTESPQCQDGIDNDGDGGTDWDGAGTGTPDSLCIARPFRRFEMEITCGLGFELCLLAPLLLRAQRSSSAGRTRR